MIVKQIWTANAYRNFNYLIACSETGEALAIDPLDHEKCLKAAKDALAATNDQLKKAGEAAQPKDIVDIVVSEPIAIRVKPTEAK